MSKSFVAMPPLLQTFNLGKHYPGVVALDGVNLTLKHGEVHVLFGENGAGKSTLISIVAGAQTPNAGVVHVEGVARKLYSVAAARALGIRAVFQEFSLVPTLSVADNLFLGDEPQRAGFLRISTQRQRARALLDELGFSIDSDMLVGCLSRAQQQMVEIAKAFHRTPKLLILDEPTASLSARETDRLFELVAVLKERGVGILYITHRMQEIRTIGDRVSVLRDGKLVTTVDAKSTSDAKLIELMAGRPIGDTYPKIAYAPEEVVLELKGLSSDVINDVSLTVRRGEVVGIAGLVGCGKSEAMRAVFGIEAVTGGSIFFKGRDVTGATPAQMWRNGMFYLSPDRRHEGLVPNFSSGHNITLASLAAPRHRTRIGLLSLRSEKKSAYEMARRVELIDRNVDKPVALLSGGNQQKVMFARGLVEGVDLYVFDEPTVGVDVGTRSALYMLIKSLTESGAAVIVVSSDLPEVMHLSHRLYVMCNGRLVAELEGENITETQVLEHFFERIEEAV